MKTSHILGNYISRLFHQTLVQVTGGLGFLVTAILELAFPGQIIKWVAYLILLISGLVVGGYQVFTDLLKEHNAETGKLQAKIDALGKKLHDLEHGQPQIIVGAQDGKGLLAQNIQIDLSPLPPQPLLDSLIAQKRTDLIAKQQQGQVPGIKGMMSSLGRPNPDYRTEVEKYLEDYRKYLIRVYDNSIIDDRLRAITPIVENRGFFPANDIVIEFFMPLSFRLPNAGHLLALKYASIGEKYKPSPPEEPNPLVILDMRSASIFTSALTLPREQAFVEAPGNTEGPILTERDGMNLIIYKIKKLIPSRPEPDFRPFHLWLGDVEETTTWEILVGIYASELHQPLHNVLQIDFAISATST
jgi:hypothetical protein